MILESVIDPAEICDAHIHIFDDPASYPFCAAAPYTPPLATSGDYRRDSAGDGRAVIVQSAVYGIDNRLLVDTIAADPKRLRGVAVIDPDAGPDVLRRLDHSGVRGVRLTVDDLHAIGRSGLASITAKLADLDWNLELLVPLSAFALLGDFLIDAPVPVVIDHVGYDAATFARYDANGDIALYDVFMRASEKASIFMKISGFYYLVEDEAGWDRSLPLISRLINAHPDRVLWGSNWPHPNVRTPPSNRAMRQAAFDACADVSVARRLFVENAGRLYRFD